MNEFFLGVLNLGKYSKYSNSRIEIYSIIEIHKDEELTLRHIFPSITNLSGSK